MTEKDGKHVKWDKQYTAAIIQLISTVRVLCFIHFLKTAALIIHHSNDGIKVYRPYRQTKY